MSKKGNKKLLSPEPEKKPEENKTKMSRVSKLYIATAICTACVCLIVVAVTTQISRSVVHWDEEKPINVPTPVPVDSILNGAFSLPSAAPTAVPTVKPTNPPQTPAPAPTAQGKAGAADGADEETVQTGLFQKKEPFSLQMPLDGEVLNDFSINRLKKSKTLGDWRTHNGVDLKADAGSAVNAVADGTVTRAGYDNVMGYVVVISHADDYQTLYANLASSEMVEEGQKIKAGECLGAVGDSAVFEKLEESHLHFELRQGDSYLNPIDYAG